MTTVTTVTAWGRFLGVSLRPWSGMSPGSMIFRAVIQIAVFAVLGFFVIQAAAKDNQLADFMASPEFAQVRELTVMVALIAVGLLIAVLLAVVRLIIGVLDLVPRRQVEGVVTSLSDRRPGDFLPPFVQTMIWSRIRGGQNGIDQRRYRTELVLQTADGVKSWTIRHHRFRDKLRVGSSVRISVSPLLGYVAKAEPIG